MAGKLYITDPNPFTTYQMLPEQGEILAAAWAEYLARNTGYLAYEPMTLPGVAELLGSGVAISEQRYAYIPAGTWVVSAFVYYWPTAFLTSYSVDGTTIVTGAGQGGDYDEGTIVMGASGWALIEINSTGATGAAGTYAAAGMLRPCIP